MFIYIKYFWGEENTCKYITVLSVLFLMQMKEIERNEGRNNDIPKREVYYYGPKETSCYLVRTIELNGYIFELYY